MNEFQKRYTVLRKNLETGIVEGHLGKPYYTWSQHHLYFHTKKSINYSSKNMGHFLRSDIYWYEQKEKAEQGKLTHKYFAVRLNSKNCPIKTTANIGQNRDPYNKMLRFELK
jgi:hypothetical protein